MEPESDQLSNEVGRDHIGVVVTLMSRLMYEASAKMLIEGPSYNLNTVNSDTPLNALFVLGQQHSVDTQVEVLQSGPLRDAVTREVGPASLSIAPVKDTNVIEVVGDGAGPVFDGALRSKI